MLTVKIQNGDEMERTFYVNDLQDLKRVQDNLIDDFQKVLAQDESEEKIELGRILDASDYDNAEDLIRWIEKMQEWESMIGNSDYDSVDELVDKVDRLSSAIEDIYYTADGVR